MTVLNKAETDKKRHFLTTYYKHESCFEYEFNYLDTIDHLRARVAELEKEKADRGSEHKPNCSYGDPFMNKPCVCGAVKEPEAIFKKKCLKELIAEDTVCPCPKCMPQY